MRHPFGSVNVVTEEHSRSYIRHDGSSDPEITIPNLRARMAVFQAKALRDDLTRALEYIESTTEGTTKETEKNT